MSVTAICPRARSAQPKGAFEVKEVRVSMIFNQNLQLLRETVIYLREYSNERFERVERYYRYYIPRPMTHDAVIPHCFQIRHPTDKEEYAFLIDHIYKCERRDTLLAAPIIKILSLEEQCASLVLQIQTNLNKIVVLHEENKEGEEKIRESLAFLNSLQAMTQRHLEMVRTQSI